MNWFKVLKYTGVAMGFTQNTLKALGDGVLTLTEGLTIVKQTFTDLVGPGAVTQDAVLLEEDADYLIIKLKKDMMNNIKLDLTQ